jgi:hypothetical protein
MSKAITWFLGQRQPLIRDGAGVILPLAFRTPDAGAVPAAVERILTERLREALATCQKGTEGGRRLLRLEGEAGEAEKQANLAAARVEELAARRRQLELSAESGLASKLVSIDRDVAAAQGKQRDAHAAAEALRPVLAEARAAQDAVEGKVLGTVCDTLATGKTRVLDALLAAATPHLTALLELDAALLLAGSPVAMKQKLAAALNAAR